MQNEITNYELRITSYELEFIKLKGIDKF